MLRLFAHHLESRPPPPSWLLEEIHPGLEKLILAAMRKDPANRYASMLEVLADLECVITGIGEVYGAPMQQERDEYWSRTEQAKRACRILGRVGVSTRPPPMAPMAEEPVESNPISMPLASDTISAPLASDAISNAVSTPVSAPVQSQVRSSEMPPAVVTAVTAEIRARRRFLIWRDGTWTRVTTDKAVPPGPKRTRGDAVVTRSKEGNGYKKSSRQPTVLQTRHRMPNSETSKGLER